MNTKQIRLGQCLIHILISIIILYGAEIAGMIISAGFAELFPSSSFKVISGTLSYITIAILCFTWYTGKFFPVVPDSLGLKRKVPACILVIVISLPLMYSLITFLILRGQGYWETSFRNNNQFISQLLTILIDIGIAAGIVEELIFRGMIMRSIESYSGKKAAVVITSVLFTILHIPGWDGGYAAFVSGCLSTMALSVLLSLLVYYSKTIWVSMLFHCATNIVNCTIYYGTTGKAHHIWAYVPRENNEIFPVISSIVMAILCCLACLFLMKKHRINTAV